MTRPSWDEYFLSIVEKIGERSTCPTSPCQACIIVHNRQIIAAGYAGAPSGRIHCDQVGCIHSVTYYADLESVAPQKPHNDCARAIHAPMNAVSQAAQFGIAIKGSDIYCSSEPCPACARFLLSIDIRNTMVVR